MENNSGTIATEVLRLLKSTYGKSMNRLYILLIIVISMLAISIVDSIYQRCRIIKIIEEYERSCIQEVIELHEHE
jgi:hypothetical protein